MKLEDEFKKYSIGDIKKIPTKICDILVINGDEYGEKKDEIDNQLISFKKKDFIGFYKKDQFRIYVRSCLYSKKICERKISDFLKGK